MSRRQFLQTFRRAAAPAPAAAGHRPLLLAVALAAGFSALPARAQSSGAQAQVGTVNVSKQGNNTLVTTTNGAGGFSSINWQSFNVPGGTITHFAQPNAASMSINRVVGGDPSAIFGTLSSNGRLVLVNPAGITVGAGAVVDTAGFTASALRMSDADAASGRQRFGDGNGGGLLRVDGQVLARQGDVVLIGQTVRTGNQALIQSPQGATILAAGQKVEVTGHGLEGIVFEVQAPADQVVNLGTLSGNAVGVFAGTLRHSGLIQAQAVTTEGGKVLLRAADMAQTSGTIVARGLGGAGGSVDVLGDKIGILAGASIDTSNSADGGRIRIGGDYQGQNPDVPNAEVVYMAQDAQLRANATASGDGGRVIVWADDTTRAYGSIEARGGQQGGDGGFVETSGKRSLDVNGARVVASAAKGRAGTWLLDPDDITIVAGSGTDVIGGSAPNYTPSSSTFQTSVLYDSTINTALNGATGTNVVIKTSNAFNAAAGSGSFGTPGGDIVLTGGVNLQRTQAGDATLTLDAWNDIRFTGGTTTFGATDPAPSPAPVARTLNVVLKAGANGSGRIVTDASGGVQTDAADGLSTVNVTANFASTSNKRWTNDGSLQLHANGTVDLGGGELLNNGYVGGSRGLLKVATFTQPAPAPASPAPTLAPFGTMSLQVTKAFNVAGGEFMFNGKDLAITQQAGALKIPAGSFGSIFASGTVKMQANAGDIVVDQDIFARGVDIRASKGSVTFQNLDTSGTLGSNGGAVTVIGATGVSGLSIYSAGGDGLTGNGGSGGPVAVTSASGAVQLGDVSSYGGDSSLGGGGGGGAVVISGRSLSIGYVDAMGGDAYGTGSFAGGDGGAVTLKATGGAIELVDGVYTYGGWGADGGAGAGGGGKGGNIELYSAAGDLDLRGMHLDAEGGGGGDGGTSGGAGGRGGNITITAAGGGVLTSAYPPFSEGNATLLSASGGWGGSSNGSAATDRGGAGGAGGTITINANGASQLLGYMHAEGGEGGWVNPNGGNGTGGAGGAGGAIALNVNGSAALGGDAMAGGGLGGGAFDASSIEDPARFGAKGAAGSFTTNGGTYAIAPGFELPTTGSTVDTYSASLNVDGAWTNNGTVVLQPYAWVLASQSVTNNGVFDLGAGSVLGLGTHQPEFYSFTPGGGLLQNNAGAVLQGIGTVEGSVRNAGTINVGDTSTDLSSTIGRFSILGDLVQQASGKLVFDVAANVPYEAGVTYDQLAVGGSAVLDGALQVNSLAQVTPRAPAPTPAPTSPPVLALALAASTTTSPSTTSALGATERYVLLDVAGGTTGSFSSYAGPGDPVISGLQMNNAGTLMPIPGVVLPAAPPPVVIPTDPLVDKILDLLNGSTSREVVQQALSEQDSVVTKFLDLLLDEEERQKNGAKGDVVYTDTACKPS